jgi:chemotaxis protein CheD
VLPYCPKDLTAEKRLVTGRRYVDFSIRQLAWQFDQLDVSRGEVQVKVFGGAEVLGFGAAAKTVIGKLNSEAAIEVLESEGFRIIASSLGGNLGRQIQFHIGTGEVTLRWLGKTRAEDVIAE